MGPASGAWPGGPVRAGAGRSLAALPVPGGGVFTEQLAELVRRDAPALVGDRDRHIQPLALRRDPDGRGVRRVARGVGEQEDLLRQVWAGRGTANPKIVRAYVKRLRHRLGDDAARPAWIVGECSLWINPNVITASDPSWLRSVEYVGRGERELWDFISNGWVARNAYLFDVQYGARQGVTEFQLHPEYGSREAAQEQVDVYAPMLGRLPLVLLSNVREIEVQIASADPTHAGVNESLGIIHINTYKAETAVLEGFMEEILLHEGAHASLDGDHARSPNWRAAQEADGRFLNNYARDYPEREDIAETT